ncbi:F-box/WD repeat-containing protein 7 [Uranotaenia lowii]|uniref:F-box/WD repeat-containing protein 7 n=1 Tax=Uranotaenia lowii TaxID=190385 RepID=UPI00247965AE|nr:F-box/WD repeat-containing protein 7 [Uranotaenia lowii]XP_055611354.1 F-box/WD repeat-containing protein 7 [Uranotaenia lowii]XP_055611355.1 F-box/WD repeat-containing protein 7 [Uranotaenia lowii]XP_055611356.1 F-box/WD repeat-containing protein 7 [Uranotaenia lowii]
MAEQCIVSISDDQQQQQQCPVSPLGVPTEINDSSSVISTPIGSATLFTSNQTGVIATVTASGSSTPTTQSGSLLLLNGDGTEPRGEDGYDGWFYGRAAENNGIQLETPAVEQEQKTSNAPGINAKPKRLSDEFYSADDDYEDEEEDDEMVGRIGDGNGSAADCGSRHDGNDCGKSVGDGDSETHASLNEIKNLSITNGASEPIRDEGSNLGPIFVNEETSSCSSVHQQLTTDGEEISVPTKPANEPSLAMDQEEIPEEANVAGLVGVVLDDDEDDDDLNDDELNDVQSIDAIERRDFEQEQKLTGGIIIKNSAFMPDTHRLNLDLISRISKLRDDDMAPEKSLDQHKIQLTSTPTSSRHPSKIVSISTSSSNSTSIREQHSNSTTIITKSAVKMNLSASLGNYCRSTESEISGAALADGPSCSSMAASSSSSSTVSSSCSGTKSHRRQHQHQLDAFLNSNSNDSLSSDRIMFIPNLQALKTNSKDTSTVPMGSTMNEPSTSSSSSSPSPSSASSAGPSTSTGATKPPSDCSLSSCATSVIKQTGECSKHINHHPIPSTSTSNSSLYSYSCPYGSADQDSGEAGNSASLARFPSTTSNFTENMVDDEVVEASSSSSSLRTSNLRHAQHHNDRNHLEDPVLEPSQLSMPPEIETAAVAVVEHECDEDNWVDCEEGSDEEICTCRDYTDHEINFGNSSSEDELPSRDVDLSSYTHMDVAEDILAHDPSSGANVSSANAGNCNAQTPRLHRKRKLTENRILFGSGGSRCSNMDTGSESMRIESPNSESLNFSSRKRLALDSTTSPRALLSPSNLTSTPTSSSMGERKTPRSIIPTKDNPPPELNDWLMQFQRWTPVERLVAIDLLIEHCEPTQVRHMMKVIEPRFQRDFISLLPKELALQVLSYLEPKDLLRAAQTCRSWRFLADDNLLWKEKCKEGNILMEATGADRPKRGRAGNMPPISSPWKAAYMRQHIIEMNWRSRPIRTPKVLKGHDDHVITCLQFSGNRIVSGSDDNTLKVWSAITGKCLRTLVGHTGGVWSSQMSGNTIISGSTDRTLKVWNADTGILLHTLYGHTSTVRCMHLHGKKVVSGSRDATLRVWDINEGTCLHVLVGHLAAVRCVQYDGRLVVSGAYDYMVKVWNPERQECLHTLQGHTNRVYSLQFDGIHVVSGSLDTSIRVWDAETGSCKHALMGHQSLTSGMELRQNILVSGNADSTVKVWDIITGQCLQTLSGPNKHQSAVTCLQFNSRFVITSSDDGTVKLWDVKTGEFIRNLIALESGGSGGVVWRIRANDTKLICAVGSRNGTEETKLMVLDFDVEGACLKCS